MENSGLIDNQLTTDAVAVFSYNTLELFKNTFCDPSDVLKRSAILFDRILFHSLGIPLELKKVHKKAELLADIVTKDQYERKFLLQSREFSDFILLMEEVVDDSKAFYRRARNISKKNPAANKVEELYSSYRLLKIAGKHPDAEDVHTWYSWKIALHIDFCLFDLTREILPNSVGFFTELHKDVLRHAAVTIQSDTKEIELITRLEKLSIADFAKLSWTRIFELRQSGFLADFRRHLSEIASRQSSGGKDIDAEVFSNMWKLVSDVSPDLPRSYLTAILGNIPLPISLNPMSLAAAVSDIKKQHELKKQYGWLFFIQEARKKRIKT